MPSCKPFTVSPARVEANRRNAQKSTGPHTARGKLQSRLDALRDGGIGVRIMVCGVPKPAKRVWSFSPWRASRGIMRPPQYFFSPVGAPSGHADSAPTGLKILWFPQSFPRLARRGPNDHATPWLKTLRGPAPLIKAFVTGFRLPRAAILTPMRWGAFDPYPQLRAGPSARPAWRGGQSRADADDAFTSWENTA